MSVCVQCAHNHVGCASQSMYFFCVCLSPCSVRLNRACVRFFACLFILLELEQGCDFLAHVVITLESIHRHDPRHAPLSHPAYQIYSHTDPHIAAAQPIGTRTITRADGCRHSLSCTNRPFAATAARWPAWSTAKSQCGGLGCTKAAVDGFGYHMFSPGGRFTRTGRPPSRGPLLRTHPAARSRSDQGHNHAGR